MPRREYELSLNEILPKHNPITDIYGYISEEFGDKNFKITRIELHSGETLDVEGEHDMPYISDDKFLTQEILESLDKET